MATSPPAYRQWLMGTFFLSASAIATYYMRVGPAALAANDSFTVIAQAEQYRFPDYGILLRRDYTGVRAIDFGLSFLVAAFLPGAAGWDRNFQLLQAYFLFSFSAVLAVWSIEAARIRNKGRVLSYTTLWAIPYQTTGGAIAIPLAFFSYIIPTSTSAYWAQSSAVSLSHAKTLLPALIIGYLLPTAMIFYPYQDIYSTQAAVALWQVSPFLVNLIWWVSSTVLASRPTGETRSQHQQHRDSLPWLKTVYALVSVISASSHWIVLYLVNTSDVQLHNVFIPQHQSEWTMASALLFIFQVDFWIIFACTTAWCFLSTWDQHHQGGATSMSFSTAAGFITLSTVLLGPGAALGLTWYRLELDLASGKHVDAKRKAKWLRSVRDP